MYKDDLLLICGLLVLFVFTAIFYIFQIPGTSYETITNDILVISPFISVVGGWYAMHAYGTKNHHGKSFMYMTLGFFSWFVGESVWAIFEGLLHISPYPSIADIFYLAAYPLLLVGIIRELRYYKTTISPMKSLFISVMSMLLSIFVFYIMIIPAILSKEPFLSSIIAIGYGIADSLLIVTISHVLMLVMDFKGGRLFHAWLYILIAAIFMLIADVLFAEYNIQYQEAIPTYKRIDLLWILSYLFFSLGMFEMKFIIRDVQKKIRQLLYP
jgi:hypothetical protein